MTKNFFDSIIEGLGVETTLQEKRVADKLIRGQERKAAKQTERAQFRALKQKAREEKEAIKAEQLKEFRAGRFQEFFVRRGPATLYFDTKLSKGLTPEQIEQLRDFILFETPCFNSRLVLENRAKENRIKMREAKALDASSYIMEGLKEDNQLCRKQLQDLIKVPENATEFLKLESFAEELRNSRKNST